MRSSLRLAPLAALAALSLAAVHAAYAQQSLYVGNAGDNTIEKFDSAGVGTKFNVSGDLNEPYGLAFSPSPAAVPGASTTVSLGLLLALGLGGMAVAAKRRARA